MNVLISGSLVKDPQERQSATAKTYATCAMRCPVEGDSVHSKPRARSSKKGTDR